MLLRFIRALRRYRYQMAAADLAFLEARAPVVIAEQARKVERLGAGIERPPALDTITITRRIEFAQKRDLLS